MDPAIAAQDKIGARQRFSSQIGKYEAHARAREPLLVVCNDIGHDIDTDIVVIRRTGDQVARRSLDFYQAVARRLAGQGGAR